MPYLNVPNAHFQTYTPESKDDFFFTEMKYRQSFVYKTTVHYKKLFYITDF